MSTSKVALLQGLLGRVDQSLEDEVRRLRKPPPSSLLPLVLAHQKAASLGGWLRDGWVLYYHFSFFLLHLCVHPSDFVKSFRPPYQATRLAACLTLMSFLFIIITIYIHFLLTGLTARDALLIIITIKRKKISCRQMFVFRVVDHRISRTAFLSSLCIRSPLYGRVWVFFRLGLCSWNEAAEIALR